MNLVIEMVYVCENCGYLFSRANAQDQCPDCGGHMVRSANAVEQGEFVSQVAELIREAFETGRSEAYRRMYERGNE